MDSWEKAKSLSTIVSAIFLPVVLLIVGNQFSSATKEREIQGKFVELATQILREKPVDKPTPDVTDLRLWATTVINRYSGVELPKAAAEALIQGAALPVAASAAPEPAASGAFAIVFGGDANLKSAQYEMDVAKKLGLERPAIYLRKGSYRSVALFASRQQAQANLDKARKRRADAYVVDFATWCADPVQREGFSECP